MSVVQQQMARWRDAWGQKYTAPAGEYTPGQFSPTGSQMLRYLSPDKSGRNVVGGDA